MKESSMSLEFSKQEGTSSVCVRVSGKLSKADYERFVPEVERLIEAHGKIRVLFEMREFHGWEIGALWEDIKFDIKHFSDIERVAMVGEKKWQEWMSTFCRPFTAAKIRYFESHEADKAREWIQE
jgi:hypothetical protein